jgi:hypothetical protein
MAGIVMIDVLLGETPSLSTTEAANASNLTDQPRRSAAARPSSARHGRPSSARAGGVLSSGWDVSISLNEVDGESSFT